MPSDKKVLPWTPPFRYDKDRGYILDDDGVHVCIAPVRNTDEHNALIAAALNALALSNVGGECKDCGFRYWAYKGHVIPCPRCEAENLKHDLERGMANHNADLNEDRSARVELLRLLREASDCLRLALEKSGADSELDSVAWERCENCIEAITQYAGEKE